MCSILGGLLLFQEYTFMDTRQITSTIIGLAVVLIGVYASTLSTLPCVSASETRSRPPSAHTQQARDDEIDAKETLEWARQSQAAAQTGALAVSRADDDLGSQL
jgi:hypothetical protein